MPSVEDRQIEADRTLVARVLSLTPGADQELITLLSRISRPILRGYFAAHDLAPALSDLSAHVWHRNWAVLRSWSQETPLERFLATVARNFAIDCLRQASHPEEEPLEDHPLPEPHWSADPERAQQAREASHCLERATGRLSEVHQTVVQLRYQHGLGHEEIAARLGKTKGYVGPTLARAEKALREALIERCKELVESLIGVRGAAHG